MSTVPPLRLAHVLRSAHQPPPSPGRNDACWCGSGRKYKGCHRRADEQSRVLDERYGPLSCALMKVVGPLIDGHDWTDEELGAFARIAARAWTISRLPEHTWDSLIFEAIPGSGHPPVQLVVLIRRVCERAARLYPDDPRMVTRAWFLEQGQARVLCASGGPLP